MTMTRLEREWHEAEIAWYNSEREKFEAEAERERAEAERAKALARGAVLTADRKAISLASEMRKEERYLAGDFESRVYRFNQQVGDSSVEQCIDKLTTWSRMEPGCSMSIYFNSPGGDIIAGMALFDTIRYLARKHHITTVALGYAASMAGILLQAGSTRIMAPEAWMLIHQGSYGAIGSAGQFEDTAEWVKRLQGRILDIFYERSRTTDAPKKLSKKQIANRWERRDWWLSSNEALDHGFCDKVE